MKVLSTDFFPIFIITVFVVACIAILGGIVLSVIKVIKTKNKNGLYTVLFSLLFIILAAYSWIANFGWLRVIFTLLCLPFIHSVWFYVTNVCCSKYVNCSKIMKVYVWIYYITYLCTYVFLPDGGDHGPMYVFFGLIRNNVFAEVAYFISMFSFMLNIAAFVVQIVQISDYKKKMKLNGIINVQ